MYNGDCFNQFKAQVKTSIMCGLLFSNIPSVTQERFLQALQQMEFRGPDAPDCYAKIGINQLGHNRLKILDLNNSANQPFFSHSRRYVITYNGEIYNYKELSQEYRLTLKTSCDTELIVELYEQLGSAMLPKLNGMFAFVILDVVTNQLFIARDRLGVKPLYYANTSHGIILASEVASIIHLLDRVTISEEGLRQYKKLRTFFNGKTLYEQIQQFPAGAFSYNLQQFSYYWRFTISPQQPPEDEELRVLIQQAVDRRMLADVEVGSYLSGGLDSSIVSALSNVQHTWTIGFPDNNEFEYAKMVADHISSTHHAITFNYEDFFATAREMIKKRKEPLSVPNEVLLYKMTQHVREKNVVILSGEGADELFFGYNRVFAWANQHAWDVKAFDQYYAYGSGQDLEIIDSVMAPFNHYVSNLDRVAAFFQCAHLHGLLRRLDFATMLCSVEARVPFVDYLLVERIAGTSYEYRQANGVIKAPLKRVFSANLPDTIIHRAKVGFPVPLVKLFNLEANETRAAFDKWAEFNLEVLGE